MSIDSIHGTTMADPMKCEDLDSLIESLRLLSLSLSLSFSDQHV